MSRSIHRLIGVSAAMTVLSLAAAGCGGDRPERAVTVDPQRSGSTADSTQEAEVVEAPEAPAGDQLSKAQIGKALLTVSDLPAGWTATPAEEEEESEDTVSPPKCKDVLDALDETSTDAAAEGEANFNKGGPFGTVLSQTISSYADPVDSSRVQKIADAFSDCPSFDSTDSDGTVSKVTVSPMSFGNLGDQTLAFAMTLESSAFTVSVNVAYVVIGHNVVAMVNGGLAGADGAQLEKLAKQAITKLEKTAN
ncbi:hypothetical protein J2X46_002969 [Nocardioides sp. BE266]|uniref:hypothetical protein n=1 Tax=Nocardioides sp. BE266 TaxID=2817725 RepID=UPI002857DCD0|nr:hypothetical protein [Nocardioides sp. BE266]MDR7253979.1 hypothetical protein [Nocardioides sp. BE266]